MKEFEQISYAKTVYGQEEVDAVSKVISNKSPFRYYGVKCDKEVFNFDPKVNPCKLQS